MTAMTLHKTADRAGSPARAEPSEPAIRMIGVHKWYGDFQVLTNCTTSVAKGEVVVVCGPSGSGKSTLVRLLLDDEDDEWYATALAVGQFPNPAMTARLVEELGRASSEADATFARIEAEKKAKKMPALVVGSEPTKAWDDNTIQQRLPVRLIIMGSL